MNANTGRLAAITTVCVIVFYVSFSDIAEVALAYGLAPRVAYAYPLCIDAMILVCALTLVASKGINRSAKFYAKLGRWFGFVATIYANALGAGTVDINAIAIHAIPAVSLIFTIELMIHGAKGTAASRSARSSKSAGNVTPIRKGA